MLRPLCHTVSHYGPILHSTDLGVRLSFQNWGLCEINQCKSSKMGVKIVCLSIGDKIINSSEQWYIVHVFVFTSSYLRK